MKPPPTAAVPAAPSDDAQQPGSVTAALGASDAWGQPVPSSDPAADPLSIPESLRYERGLELGRGGMGRVVAARDRRLGRQVAIKELRPGANQRAAAARLSTEAQLTAGLDHPGILAIHDAGRDNQGQPWYAMRLVRGQTLTQAARALPTLTERLRLIRALLAVCQAVAHAHEQQIIHRDLKPDNVLVGRHDETQVADWGLACTLTQAAVGGVVGTAEYMAPEVAAGQPASPRSDVYSLGATLVAVLHAQEVDLLRLALSLPLELAAIAERCLAPDPLQRYPDAAALADDLSAWLEGRRVAAHRYSAMQLLGRLGRAFRLPLLVGAVALLGIVAVAWQGYRRTANQRDRAVLAEQLGRKAQAQAEQANRAAEANLAMAYVQAAESAEAAGAHPEAETLAAAAVALRESPAAQGILARPGLGPEVQLAADFSLPSCRRMRLSPDGKWLLCIQDQRALLLRGDSGQQQWQRPGVFGDGAVSSVGNRVLLTSLDYQGVLLELLTGSVVDSGLPLVGWLAPLAQRDAPWMAVYNSRHVQLIDLTSSSSQRFAALCSLADGLVSIAFAPAPGTLHAACRSGRLTRVVAGQAPRPLGLAVPSGSQVEASALTVTADGRTLLGTLDGHLWADGQELPTWSGGVHRLQPSVQALCSGPAGGLAAIGEGLGPVVWTAASGQPVRLPQQDRQAVAFVDAATIAVAGERLRRYRLHPAAHPERFIAGSGVSQLALSPDARLLAAGGGDGTVTIWQTDSAAVATAVKLSAGVAKSLAFSPDGKQLAVGLADAPGFVLLQVGSWLPLPVASTVLIKRLGYFANGVLWRSTYSDGFDVLPPGAQAAQPLGGCPKSLCSQGETGANAAQTALVHVSVGGELTLIRQQEPERAESLLHVPWVAAVALSADSHTVAIAEEARVRLLDVGSRSFFRELTDPGQRILHIAFSADDRLLVAGELDRTVRVWRLSDGVEIAVLRGHSQRVVQVLFAPPALGLLSASWDGTIARWELDRLVAAPTVLPGLVAAKWALPIEAALRPPAR